jgi:hypothetical protein
MDDAGLEAVGQELIRQIEEARRRCRTTQWRCPNDLRARIEDHALACAAQGESQRCIGLRLGLPEATVSRWVRRASAGRPGFRQVAIVPAPGPTPKAADSEPQDESPTRLALRLTTPSGFIVDGLSPQLLLEILRVLG